MSHLNSSKKLVIKTKNRGTKRSNKKKNKGTKSQKT